MSLNRFKFLFAYRNVTANKKSSLVVILTLSLVFCLLILLLGMHSTFSRIYQLQALNDYKNIDIVINYDEYSQARLINQRDLKDEYDEYFDTVIPFFNFNVLTETDEDLYYSQMFASLDYEFERLIDDDVEIRDEEVIITKSFAEEHLLEIGDDFTFYILDDIFNYTVGDIFEDNGIFSNASFYVDKEQILYEVYGLTTLTNFGNTIYLNVSDGYDIDEVVQMLKDDDVYGMYHVFPTVDWEYIDNRAMDLSSMMLALGIIVLIAIILVLDSLFPIVNQNMRQNLGVINTLGGEPNMIYHVSSMQWLIYIVISFVIGSLLSLFVVNYGTYVYGLSGYVPVRFMPVLISFAIVFVFVQIRAYLAFKKENKISVASQSKNRRFQTYKTQYILIVIATVLLILELVFVFFGLALHSLIIVILSVYLALNLASLSLILISKALQKAKLNSVFRIFQLKYLIKNKHIHQSLRVLFISLLSMVLIFSVRSFMYGEIDSFYEIMDFDIAVTNINNYNDNLLNEIKAYDVSDADESIFYQNIIIYLNEEDYQPARFFLSMERDRFDTYFNLNILDYDSQYEDETIPYALIPRNYRLIYNIQTGDHIHLKLNYLMEDVEVVVAGFLDINLENFVYTNLYEIEQYSGLAKYNTIFANTDNVDDLNDQLIRDYSDKMYFILNPDIYFNTYIAGVENVTNYFTVFTSFMILCFVIVIFNNTLLVFIDLKNDIAKIKVLGANNLIFAKNLLQEFIMILAIVLVIGIIEINVLSDYLKNVVLFTKFYKEIGSTPQAILYGSLITSAVLLVSYVYYLTNISKLKLIDEMKIY